MKNQDHIQRPSGARRFLAFLGFSLVAALPWALMATARGAGTLTPVGSPQAPIQIRSHQVDVTINNGFARTEVTQIFFNPNSVDLEAVYAFPVPKSASLSEVTIHAGEKILRGEVLPKAEAQAVYEDEKAKGNDAGLASKNTYQTYEFRVSSVRANAETQLSFVYYQPLEIDTGVGRYHYPLEDGGTDDAAQDFWQPANSRIEGGGPGRLVFNVELKSAWPVDDVRVPGFENAASIRKLDTGHYQLTLDRPDAGLDRDFVLYYRLADNLPGRVEVIPYRAAKDKPGTFMMVVTPGIDLQPITRGADYTYVLDVSGSMQGKIATLANGVSRALGQMRETDRFRIVTFNNSGREVLGWTPATRANVERGVELVKSLTPNGGTDIHAGLKLALRDLDADRASSIVLVTDGVANQGVVDPKAFHALLKKYDIRFFGFLMGNSANWPLMRTMADATGGFYAGVSNDDDIVGQILLAKSKIAFESLHDASFRFKGARVTETTGDYPQKIYRGQQLVIFGRYDSAGEATVQLKAKLTGEDKTYTTTFNFPETDTDNPEIERLWALAQIEQLELLESIGQLPPAESKDAITHLGVEYQLVTDHTAMVVLDDATFAGRGIDRKNRDRIATERTAQSARAQQPVKNYQVDAQQPTYSQPAPHVSRPYSSGGGGGALDSKDVALMLFFAFLAWAAHLGRRAARQR
ncbi:von Willebrand factor A [Opitutaceae bacterium TAV5]|nr:von Willebrand factor A [Opitutaceae bacterium TAV5]